MSQPEGKPPRGAGPYRADAPLASLRAVLDGGEHDRRHFLDVVAAVESTPETERLQALELAQHETASWPPEVTRLPDEWIVRLLHSERVPVAALSRALVVERALLDGADLLALTGAPELRFVERIKLASNAIGDQGVEALAACAHLGALRELDLESTSMTGAGLRALGASRCLPRLRSLRLGGMAGLETADWRALAEGPAGQGIAELALWNASLTPEAVEALAPLLGRLERLHVRFGDLQDATVALVLSHCGPRLAALDLHGQRVGPASVELLARPDGWPALRELGVSNSRLGPAGGALLARVLIPQLQRLRLSELGQGTVAAILETCAKQGGLPALEALDLSRSDVTDEMLVALGGLREAPRLRELDVSFSRLTSAGLVALATAPCFAELRALSLGSGALHFGHGALAPLLRAERARSLEQLRVSGALYAGTAHKLGPRLAELVAQSPHLTGLRALALERAELGPRGARALADAAVLGNLRRLDLTMSGVGAEGAMALAESPWLRGLRELDLRFDELDRATLERLFSMEVFPAMTRLEVSGPVRELVGLDTSSERLGDELRRDVLGPFRNRPRPSAEGRPASPTQRFVEAFEADAAAAWRILVGREPATPPGPGELAPGRGRSAARSPVIEQPTWEHQIELGDSLQDLSAGPDGAIVVVTAETIACVEPKGTLRWRREAGRSKEPWQPFPVAARVGRDRLVWVAYIDGALDVLDLTDGEIRARLRPAKEEMLYRGVTLSLAPHCPSAVLCGNADAGSFEATRDVRLVGWELEPPRARWTYAVQYQHQMISVPPELMPDGTLYFLVEKRGGGGSVVQSTTLYAGTLAAGPADPITLKLGGEKLRAIRAVGSELFVLTERAFGRLDRTDAHRFHSIAVPAAASGKPLSLEPPFAVHGSGLAFACLSESFGNEPLLVVQREGQTRRYALDDGASPELAFSAEGRLWVGFGSGLVGSLAS